MVKWYHGTLPMSWRQFDSDYSYYSKCQYKLHGGKRTPNKKVLVYINFVTIYGGIFQVRVWSVTVNHVIAGANPVYHPYPFANKFGETRLKCYGSTEHCQCPRRSSILRSCTTQVILVAPLWCPKINPQQFSD
jgi:hypothetical protein